MTDNGTTTTYTYDKNNRLLTETKPGSVTSYTYDANGNMLTGDGATYIYDARDRQFGFVKGTTSASYTYYPTGLRKSKLAGGVNTSFLWDGGNMICEYTASATAGKVYVYGLTLISQEDSLYYIYNAHGDVVKYISGTGALLKTYEYDAFGEEVNASSIDANPFRYAGQYFDTETGTYYLRARYYSPAMGRFTQQDAWGYGDPSDPLSLNLYVYCINNPVLYVDLDGHSLLLAMAIGAGLGALIGAGLDLGMQLITNGGDFSSVDWRSVGASAVSGGLTGSMGVVTGGMSTVGGAFAASALTGGVGYGSYHLINGSEVDYLDWAFTMGVGGIMGGATQKFLNKNVSGLPDVRRLRVSSKNAAYEKASFLERMSVKDASIFDLYGNPGDDFFNPKVGPSNSKLKYHMQYIAQNNTIEEPIVVQKLASGGYEIVDGHHRWYAAFKMGLEKVPIKIHNYNN